MLMGAWIRGMTVVKKSFRWGSAMKVMAAKLWASAQELLRTMMRADIYDLWFAPLKATGFDGQVLTLQVANDFCEVWLSDNYLGLIREVLARTSGQPLHVQFQVAANQTG